MSFRWTSGYRLLLALALLSAAPIGCKEDPMRAPDPLGISVLTRSYDEARTGANLKEVVLRPERLTTGGFGKLFTRAVEGYVYAQPLFLHQLAIPGKGTHNVVFVATEHNRVYAFDADDPAAGEPLWQVDLGPPVPADDISTYHNFVYKDLVPEIGVTGTPVIDAAAGTLFLESMTKENGGWVHKLHALDVASGAQRPQSPAILQAQVPGSGSGSKNGVIEFQAIAQLNRPALLLSQGRVYIAFGSFAGAGYYHGWVLAYDARTLAQVGAFNNTPDGEGAGIWQSGQGLSADAEGNVYVLSASGTSDAMMGGRNYGLGALKLRAGGPTGLEVADWFVPYDVATHEDFCTGMLLVPGTSLGLAATKLGWLFTLDRNQLGHFQAGGDTQIIQRFKANNASLRSAPVYWKSRSQELVYTWGGDDTLKAFRRVEKGFDPTPVAHGVEIAPSMTRGGNLTLSADGDDPTSGILWAIQSEAEDGVLRAYDASDVGKELWNSGQSPARDRLGKFAKFTSPIVADGKVYCPTFSGELAVYGLIAAK